jgi:hypothetical protein
MNRWMTHRRGLATLIVLGALLAANSVALAAGGKGNDNPGVLPLKANAFGKSYEEWSAAWWQWAYSLPAPRPDGHPHPLFDRTGADCDEGQRGKVWFLGGIIGTTDQPRTDQVERHCAIPAGKAIFFPILNTEVDNVGAAKQLNKDQLRSLCIDLVKDPGDMQVTIDGDPLRNPESYAITPTPFRYDIPDELVNNGTSIYDFFGVTWPGELDEFGAYSCGYYVMLAPLSKGQHTVIIAASNPVVTFDVTYTLDIGGGAKAASVNAGGKPSADHRSNHESGGHQTGKQRR